VNFESIKPNVLRILSTEIQKTKSMEKLDKIITTVIVLILSTHLATAQFKTTASLENPISILMEETSVADSTIRTTYSVGVYLIPSTVGAVTPATFHAKETKAYANATSDIDAPKRTMMFKQTALTSLIASNAPKP
jgi:hypothetical protein